MSLSIASAAKLHNGVLMPMLGYGTFKCPDDQQTVDAIQCAIDAGYRHIDTAMVYKNEASVGRGIRDCGIPREEIFLTTKCWNTDLRQGYDAVLKAFDDSLQRLGLDYVDLYLIHWPTGDFVSCWKAMEKIYEGGRVRAIGVSNFLKHHFDKLFASCHVGPMVNQIECHPRYADFELQHYCKQHKVQYEAWSPIMQGKAGDVPMLVDLADKYGRSPSQIILRWDLQHGIVTIPKSMTPSRIRENADLFDFELSDEDMDAIDEINENKRLGPHPDEITF